MDSGGWLEKACGRFAEDSRDREWVSWRCQPSLRSERRDRALRWSLLTGRVFLYLSCQA